MFVSQIQSTANSAFRANPVIINGKKFVPKTEYKGPVLKLTNEDKQKIAKIQEKINNLSIEHAKIDSILRRARLSFTELDYYNNELIKLDYWIEEFQQQIEDIKKERLKSV